MAYSETRFHAVGQGCFYSAEIFCAKNSNPFHLVYDCGSETAGGALRREIAVYHQMIHDEKLDMLVLSHLDADHVNGLSTLLDNGLTARNVFLPYLTPAQRAIVAASAGEETDPNYFELLADPVGFLESRGVENIIFVGGGEDDSARSNDPDVPPIQPPDEGRDSPNLGNLEDDKEGEMLFDKSESGKVPPPGFQPPQSELPLEPAEQREPHDARQPKKAERHFKRDSQRFRLTRCWHGKFFHRDDMRMPVGVICNTSDFTIRPGDLTSFQRYKRFLADVHDCFGTLDAVRLVMAIRDNADRKKLRACYHHIRGNHNDVSLVLWHGPIQVPAFVRLNTGACTRGWRLQASFHGCNGGTLLTGDLTCTDRVVLNMERHFGSLLPGSAFLQVPHHGSVHSWNTRLLAATSLEIMPVICAGIGNGYRHPHPPVIGDLENTNGGVRWFVSDERNTVAMRIQTL